MAIMFLANRRRAIELAACCAGALVILLSDPAEAGIAGIKRVASGLQQAIAAAYAPGDPTRLFIAERPGTIRVLHLDTGILEPTPFVTIPSVDMENEGGFLGLAFHPDYQTNGKFYVYVTLENANPDSPFNSHVLEYAVSSNPNVANPAFKPIIEWEQPQSNHNAGWIGFSPADGYLYVSSGDGGNGYDMGPGHTEPGGNAQDVTDNLLGKMLRIDVDGDDFPADDRRNYAIPSSNPFVGREGDDEIWAYGLRNPFRNSFDRATGDLWIADVGQFAREEINFQPASSPGAENYGWRLREGSIQTPHAVGGAKPPGNVDPVYDYPQTPEGPFTGRTVMGGYVYRGPDPELQGTYFFADAGDIFDPPTTKYWTFDSADIPRMPGDPPPTVTDIEPLLTPDVGAPFYPLAFAEDAVGNIYLVYATSEVYRIVTDALTPGDFDADAEVDGADLALWRSGFAVTSGAEANDGDGDEDGDVDGADFLAWQRNVGWSPLNNVSPANAAVPEPAAAMMIAGMLLSAAVTKRARLRSASG